MPLSAPEPLNIDRTATGDAFTTQTIDNLKIVGVFEASPKGADRFEAHALSVSGDGTRLVIQDRQGHSATGMVLIDRAEKTLRSTSGTLTTHVLADGKTKWGNVEGIAIAYDGQSVIAAHGSILSARDMCATPFDGSAPSQYVHKVKASVMCTFNMPGSRYVTLTHKSHERGFVGLYKHGSSRALAKLKKASFYPWRIAVNAEGTRLLVLWMSKPTCILEHYDLSAKKPKLLHHRVLHTNGLAAALEDRIAYTHEEYANAKSTFAVHLIDTNGDRQIPLEIDPDFSKHASENNWHISLPNRPLAFSEDGEYLFVAQPSGSLAVYRFSDGQKVHHIPLKAIASPKQASSDGIVEITVRAGRVWVLYRTGTVFMLG